MLRRLLINFIAKNFFKLVTEDEFLRYEEKTGRVFNRNIPLTQAQIDGIIHEAKSIQENQLFQYMVKEMTFLANKKMFFDSTSENDIVAGKMILWTLDVMTRKIDNIRKLGGK